MAETTRTWEARYSAEALTDLPANGREVAQYLELLYRENVPEGIGMPGDDPIYLLFSQIISNLAHDSVSTGIQNTLRNTLKNDGVPRELLYSRPSLTNLPTYFSSDPAPDGKNKTQSALAVLENGLSTVQYVRVQTPHPTEELDLGGIKAVKRLRATLRKLKIQNMRPEATDQDIFLNNEDKNELVLDLQGLRMQLSAPTKKMSPEREVERGINEYARDCFDAIPIIMAEICYARRFLAGGNPPPAERTPAPLKFLRNMYNVISVESWAGTDQDSKPLATPSVIEFAFSENRKSIRKWYVTALKNISSELKKTGDADAKSAASKLDKIWRTLDHIQDNPSDVIKALDDLEKIKEQFEAKGMLFPPARHPKARQEGLSELDVLIVQMGNFAGQALKQQVRQNSEQHDIAISCMVKKLGEKNLLGNHTLDDLLINGKLKDEHVKTILDLVLNNPGIGVYLRQEVQDIGAKIQLRRSVTDVELLLHDTLRSYQLASENPEAAPTYLIAECKSKFDILKAFTMLKAMTDPELVKDSPNRRIGQVAITPLIEHREDIERRSEIVNGALDLHPAFEEHVIRQFSGSPLMQIYDTDRNKMRQLTLGDAQEMFGIERGKGSGEIKIDGIMVVMDAGSDTIRGSGHAIVPIMGRAREDTKLTLIQREGKKQILVIDYGGSGGAVARKNPDHEIIRQTVQGRSLRDSGPEEIAETTITKIARALGQKHREGPISTKTDLLGGGTGNPFDTGRKRLSQLRSRILDSSVAGCTRYEGLFKDPLYATFMSHASGVHYTKLFNFSARPDSRIGAEDGDNSWPPPVNPKKLRAIGYGLSHAVAGGFVHLFYGIKGTLRLDDFGNLGDKNRNEIAKTARRDPDVQDELMRAAYGLVMADFDTQWKFAGFTRSRDGTTVTNMKTDEEYNINELAQKYDKYVKNGHKMLDNSKPSVELMIAAFDREHQWGAQALYEIFEHNNKHIAEEKHKRPYTSPNVKDLTPAEKLRAVLPHELKEEIDHLKGNLTKAREILASYHLQMLDGTITMPSISHSMTSTERNLYDRMWAAFATVVEATERAPEAMRAPELAKYMDDMRYKKSLVTPQK